MVRSGLSLFLEEVKTQNGIPYMGVIKNAVLSFPIFYTEFMNSCRDARHGAAERHAEGNSGGEEIQGFCHPVPDRPFFKFLSHGFVDSDLFHIPSLQDRIPNVKYI